MNVYVLESSNKRLYIGVTNNLARRIQEHNAGESIQSRMIKGKDSFTLLHTWEVPEEVEAFKLEQHLHQFQRRSNGCIRGIIKNHPTYDSWLEAVAQIEELSWKDAQFMQHVLKKTKHRVQWAASAPISMPSKKPVRSLRALLDAKKLEVEGLQKLCTLLGIE